MSADEALDLWDRAEPGHEGHVYFLNVDDHDYLYGSCYFVENGALHGDQAIYGRLTPERAEVVRRAARAYALERGWS